jgi:hypothetical protein
MWKQAKTAVVRNIPEWRPAIDRNLKPMVARLAFGPLLTPNRPVLLQLE